MSTSRELCLECVLILSLALFSPEDLPTEADSAAGGVSTPGQEEWLLPSSLGVGDGERSLFAVESECGEDERFVDRGEEDRSVLAIEPSLIVDFSIPSLSLLRSLGVDLSFSFLSVRSRDDNLSLSCGGICCCRGDRLADVGVIEMEARGRGDTSGCED